jgi:UDP-N-acetylmuramate dehydrogenase
MPRLRDFIEKINIKADLSFDEVLAPHTTFRVGGPADLLIAPWTREDLLGLLAGAAREGLPLFVLGGGANIVVSDLGIRGIVVDTRHLDGVARAEAGGGGPNGGADGSLDGGGLDGADSGRDGGADGGRDGAAAGETLLVAGSGLTMDGLCEKALDLGLAGLETFYGMPGRIGGAVYMNARCYEVEVADRLAWVESVAATGGAVERRRFDRAEWAYKSSPFQPGGAAGGRVILGAAFRLREGEREAIAEVMRAKRADRETKGHYRLPSAGSTFKNDRRLGAPTGKLLDELGMRGRRVGGAMVSPWHANIFVNAGGATASDIAALVDLVRGEARARLGVELESEILFVGEFPGRKEG